MLAFQPQLYALKTHHAIDRKMPSIIAQKFNIIEAGKPFIIINHNRIIWPIAKSQKPFKSGANGFLVFVNFVLRQELAAFILARRVADFCCAAANHHNRPMTCLLQAAQHEN